jgi:hypothetical protein
MAVFVLNEAGPVTAKVPPTVEFPVTMSFPITWKFPAMSTSRPEAGVITISTPVAPVMEDVLIGRLLPRRLPAVTFLSTPPSAMIVVSSAVTVLVVIAGCSTIAPTRRAEESTN